MKSNLESGLTAMESNIGDLNDQKRSMLKQAQELYDEMISKAKKWLDDMTTEINAVYQSQLLVLKQSHTRINNAVSRIELSIGQIKTLRSKPIDAKLFLRIQDILSDMKQYQDDFKAPICNVQLSFVRSKQIQDFISSSYNIASVKGDKSKCEITIPKLLYPVSSSQQSHAGPANKVVAAAGKRESKSETTIPEILYPVSSTQQSRASPANKAVAATGKKESARQSVALTQLKGRKLRSYNVKLSDERNACWITGLTITNDGRRLLVDNTNWKVKLFSLDMKLSSSLTLSGRPCGIAVLSNQEAVVTTDCKELVLLDTSGRHMSINTTTALSYDVGGISQYGEKFVVTSFSPRPVSVKLIDKTGIVYWSVPTNDQGQSLFSEPRFVTSDIEINTVTVTDFRNDTLTVLNGDTGDVIKRRSVKDKWPKGVTTGPSGKRYVCYNNTREVAELTGDLAEERILLSQQDGLGARPTAIAYDKSRGQLVTSYNWFFSDGSSVDVWELSYTHTHTNLKRK